MRLNQSIKPGFAPLLISLMITTVLLIPAGYLVIGDLAASTASGEPETGWGILIAMVVFGPLLVIALIFDIMFFLRYKATQSTYQPQGRLEAPDSTSDDTPIKPTVG